jgi:CO/xanthine dehydrogenase FAD-binding subunit
MIFASHAAIPPFLLVRPTTLAEAVAAKAAGGPAGHYLAGGVELVPALREGRTRADLLIDLARIAELRRIELSADRAYLGALVTYRELECDDRIGGAFPALAEVWSGVANIRVRHAATVGGNVMCGDPSYDLLPALIALEASAVVARHESGRAALATLPLDGPLPDGLIAGFELPLRSDRRFGMDRTLKPAVSVAMGVQPSRGQVLVTAAFGCTHDAVQRVQQSFSAEADSLEMGRALVSNLPAARSDTLASSDYRGKAASTLAARLFEKLRP